MSTSITFRVPCVPVAQPRQRIAVRGGRAVNYTPSDSPVNAFKASVRHAFYMVYMGPPLDGPVGLSVSFLMPRPTSKIWKRKPMPREWYPKRPDWDNLAKSLCDSLNGLAYFDDNQIVEAIIRKQIAEGSEQPGALVHIWDKPYLTESRLCV